MGGVMPEETPADMIGGYDKAVADAEDAAMAALIAGPDGRHVETLVAAEFVTWVQDAWPCDGSNGYEFIASGSMMEGDGYRFVVCGGMWGGG